MPRDYMKKLKAVLQVVIPYVCVMALMMVSICYLVKMLEDNYREEIYYERQSRIDFAVEKFQERISMVERIANVLGNNTLVEQYAYSNLTDNGYSVTLSMELRDELKIYCINNSLTDIFFYSEKKDKIISSKVVLSNAEYFFRYAYGLEEFSPYEQIERLQNLSVAVEYSPVMTAYTNPSGRSKEASAIQVIEYRKCVPIEWRKNNAIQMVIVIEAANFLGDFYDIIEEGGEVYVYDKNNRLIFGGGERYESLLDSTKELELSLMVSNEQKVYGAVQYTEDDNWRVKVFIPDLQSSGSMVTPVVIMPILGSIILSFWFTFRNYSEIIEILHMFQIHGSVSARMKDGNKKLYGYQEIKKATFEIINENNRYLESITDLKLEQKYYVMDKLLSNAYESQEEIINALEKINFDKWNSKVLVLCIWYEGSDYRKMLNENESVKDLVRNELPQLVEREVEFFEKTARESVCILFFKEADNVNVVAREIISKLNIEIFYPFDIKVKVGVGNIVDSIYEIAESYEQAKQVIKYKSDAGKNVYLYSELTEQKDIYFYPDEYNDKICSYVILGRTENAKELIRKLYQENFENNTILLSYEAIYMLKERLEKCMLTLIEKSEFASKQVLDNLHQAQDIEEYFNGLYDFIDLFVKEIDNKKEREQSQLVDEIIKYIDLHYNENSLGVKQIASEFGFQENYMSKLFKDRYGEKISVIIENVRMKKACDMLKNTDMIISNISAKVGYNSDISFRRAFKKVMGITPGEYREVNFKD